MGCGVWSGECEVRSVKCEAWGVECGVWSVGCAAAALTFRQTPVLLASNACMCSVMTCGCCQ